MTQNTSPEQSGIHEELEVLVGSLSPGELAAHSTLAGVYEAAGLIALSSYNGRLSTSPVDDFPEGHVDLVHQLLRRYDDGKGFINFPVVRAGRVMELVISASSAARYRLVRGQDPCSEGQMSYFTSFPDLTRENDRSEI